MEKRNLYDFDYERTSQEPGTRSSRGAELAKIPYTVFRKTYPLMQTERRLVVASGDLDGASTPMSERETIMAMQTAMDALEARPAVSDEYQQDMLVIAYDETVDEAFARGASPLNAHMEGVVAASMLLSALTGIEDEPARRAIVALGLRPKRGTVH